MAGVNFDTSVLVDYLRLRLDDHLDTNRLGEAVTAPDRTVALVEDDDRRRVIGGTVDGELAAVCDRHHGIYDDLLAWASDHPETELVEYDPTEREIHLSDNDIDFVRFEVLVRWHGDDRLDQLSDFRQLKQHVETIERAVRDRLDHVYRDFSADELADELADLDLEHDRGVVIDAASIADRDGIDVLVATDDDLTDNEAAINDRLAAADWDVSLEVRDLT